MKMTTSFIFFVTLIIGTSVQAKVWHATNTWSLDWERRFSQWVRTSRVHENLFTDYNSPYYGVKADCADTAYGIRAIFSMENSLPFRVKNPSGSRSGYGTLNNDTNRFDYAGPENKRLVAFINYLGGAVGTEHLNYHDTLPVGISSVLPGMLFTYKIKRDTGLFIRHAYNIKDITPTGYFDVIFATQVTANEGLPLSLFRGITFSNAPHSVWGFKRFKWPAYINSSPSQYPAGYGYSQEQFQMSQNLGPRGFFDKVKKTLQSVEETPEELLWAKLTTLCNAAIERITYVDQGVNHHRRTRRCMNYADYDAYSTPSRDKSLKADFESLFYEMGQIERQGLVGQVDYGIWDILTDIRSGSAQRTYESDLTNMCPIEYRPGVAIHLAELNRRMKSGLLSSHPNDEVGQRWGETTRGRTNCKVWY